jgi:3,4-dihydroxy 2-butanone 4-phosphate synthase/GTP cyclohydrolase II
MDLNSVKELVEDIRLGKMVILMDDEDRENEGDLVVAASMITPEHINFMAKNARGLICLTLTRERCEFLRLPLMVHNNNAQFATNFTVSIEAAEGVTTGISAADRAITVQRAVSSASRPEDIVMPGHIFPLMAQPGGVLSRAGHTEAGCDLASMAGLEAASVIVEIMMKTAPWHVVPILRYLLKNMTLKSEPLLT